MKNPCDYSKYKCPYSHLEKEFGHELKGPEGYENTYGVWCACGYRGPCFYLNPDDLGLKKAKAIERSKEDNSAQLNTALCTKNYLMDNGTVAFKKGNEYRYRRTTKADCEAPIGFPFLFVTSELPGDHYLSDLDISVHFELKNRLTPTAEGKS